MNKIVSCTIHYTHSLIIVAIHSTVPQMSNASPVAAVDSRYTTPVTTNTMKRHGTKRKIDVGGLTAEACNQLITKLEMKVGCTKEPKLEWDTQLKMALTLPGHAKCCICGDTNIRSVHQCKPKICGDIHLSYGTWSPVQCANKHITWPGGSADLSSDTKLIRKMKTGGAAHTWTSDDSDTENATNMKIYFGDYWLRIKEETIRRGWRLFVKRAREMQRFYHANIDSIRAVQADVPEDVADMFDDPDMMDSE